MLKKVTQSQLIKDWNLKNDLGALNPPLCSVFVFICILLIFSSFLFILILPTDHGYITAEMMKCVIAQSYCAVCCDYTPPPNRFSPTAVYCKFNGQKICWECVFKIQRNEAIKFEAKMKKKGYDIEQHGINIVPLKKRLDFVCITCHDERFGINNFNKVSFNCNNGKYLKTWMGYSKLIHHKKDILSNIASDQLLKRAKVISDFPEMQYLKENHYQPRQGIHQKQTKQQQQQIDSHINGDEKEEEINESTPKKSILCVQKIKKGQEINDSTKKKLSFKENSDNNQNVNINITVNSLNQEMDEDI